jgi:nicotinate phosphoribosyltransferase
VIITSLLDNDFYKFTMGQIAFLRLPWVEVVYKFKCRNCIKWTQEEVVDINYEITKYCDLFFFEDEIEYLRGRGYFKESYLEFLRCFRPNRGYVDVKLLDNGELDITIKGPWYSTIYFEVPILAICGQVHWKHSKNYEEIMNVAEIRLTAKKQALLDNKYNFTFSEFGTRRRFNRDFQGYLIKDLATLPQFTGTSNVFFSKMIGKEPIGTMAHEFIQVGQGLDNVVLRSSQRYMLQMWCEEYRGYLATALTDTIGTDAFLNDFDYYFAKLFDGLRHDSGDPIAWATKVLAHYRKLGIDPRTKTLVFSDKLDFETAQKINIFTLTGSKTTFGIGTYLVNDTCTPALQNVIKLQSVNGRPVAKISDEPGKGMCQDANYLDYLKRVYGRV